jgi:2-polyprenyl-6-methoxyphenol hydroxylase-like FAD-dependent oxidoreductase
MLIGDPSSGQGINQALEDVYSLTLLLAATAKSSTTRSSVHILEALEYWQRSRQHRVDAVFDWAVNSTNVQRLSEGERKQLVAEGKLNQTPSGSGDDMSWLYQSTLEDDIRTWIKNHAKDL